MSFRAASIKCQACGKTVYAMEAMQADGKTFHKGCMKCAECNGVLKLGNYAAVGGKYYCKPHFKQLFKLKGNYSSGFGDDKQSSHSFSVPTGRVDFNRGSGLKTSNPTKPSPTSSPVPSHVSTTTPAPSTTEAAPATEKPATAVPSSTVSVPHLASPTPVHRAVPAAAPSLGSSGGGAGGGASIGARGGLGSSGGSSFEGEKSKLEAEKKALEEEKKRFEEEKRRKDAEAKAAVAAAEKELAAAKEVASSAPAPATPGPVTLSASEILICDAFSALLADATKKDLALRKVGLAK